MKRMFLIILGGFVASSVQLQSNCKNSGQNLTALNGTVSYDLVYQNCYWIMRPCGAGSVTLHFSDFSIYLDDEVRVFSCSRATCDSTIELPGSPFSGYEPPPDITSCTGIMKLQFRSQSENIYSTFTATYTGFKPGDNSKCPEGGPAENICFSSSEVSINQSTSEASQLPSLWTPVPSDDNSILGNAIPPACPIPSDLLKNIKQDCGGQQPVCDCIISTIESEANTHICNAYVDPNSPFRNAVVNCLGRDCGEFQFFLVFCLLVVGGMLGGVYLYLANGCTFRPHDQDEKSEAQALEECADDFAKSEDDTEQLPTEVDCGDGIEDGEMGVIAQFVLNWLYRAALEGSEEERQAAKTTVAKLAAFAFLLRKLGLKLILAVPLVLQKNWIPVGAFLIDVVILVYCAVQSAYLPGSLYNEVHVLVKGRRFVRTYHWRRFSLWMKFFVGFQV